jgi:hypothetical protein
MLKNPESFQNRLDQIKLVELLPKIWMKFKDC